MVMNPMESESVKHYQKNQLEIMTLLPEIAGFKWISQTIDPAKTSCRPAGWILCT